MIKNIYNNIVTIDPYLEVFMRRIYWNNNFLINIYNRRSNKTKDTLKKIPSNSLYERLGSLGIKKGDLLIVHSSYERIQRCCKNFIEPESFIRRLIDLIGSSGTIAFPTHPMYSTKKITKEYILDKKNDNILTYSVKRTLAWTGFLPNIFMRLPGVIRSSHPINTMAAYGNLAEKMMENNIEGDRPLACGEGSSWKFCSDNRAKIIGIGVDLVHSLTMMHVAEDCNKDWPIKDWYRDRTFKIVSENSEMYLKIRERKPKWTINFAERCLRKDLIKNNILKVNPLGELPLEFIEDSKDLINYLNFKNHNGYPYFIKRKLWKQ